MRLKTVKLRNFRGYKDTTIIPFNNLTAFIGKNDIGKSTILEALEIFFNGETKSSLLECDKTDLCIYAEDNIIEITCIFDELPKVVKLDAKAETTLSDEYLLNNDGDLEIKKRYDCSLSKPKVEVFFVCRQPSDPELQKLLHMKNSDLKDLASKMEIDKNEYNSSINTQIRAAIRRAKPIEDLTLIDLAAKNDGKELWDSIQMYIPLYALFQSDRNSTDSDREIIDPMKIAIKQALKAVSSELELIKQRVMKEALDTAKRTLQKLNEMSPDLADSLVPEFSAEPKFDSIFKLTINSDNNIPMNKRGSGLRRLLLLNFFRAEAERKMTETNRSSVIYAFEEPETSQHPDNQMLLIEAFKELSNKNNIQVILTSHNPALVGMLNIENLRFVSKSENNERKISFGSDDVYEEICTELGMLPIPIEKGINAILLVEGHSDVVFLKHIANMYYENKVLDTTFENERFAVIPVGGCGSLKHWRELKLLEQYNLPWCVLFDSDIGAPHKTDNINKIQELKREGIKAYVTRKREPENYISLDCIRDYIKSTDTVSYSDTDDAKKIIAHITNIREVDVLTKLWPKMTFEQIRSVDKYEENGEVHYEFEEMLKDFFSISNS